MRILGLDLGTKTLGIAISDRLGLIANPYKTIKYNNQEDLINELEEIIKKEQITKIILGNPKNMNNSETEAANRSKEFKKLLEDNFNLEVILIDERLSTKEAENILISGDMSRKKRKNMIDKLAATIILENYLNRKR
ncbi:MAG TPA: Holliday junction resolvase RuvX [Bacilli bacterium]|nr:Holliday junction resolvase RuvX [Bacilli bacterium]